MSRRSLEIIVKLGITSLLRTLFVMYLVYENKFRRILGCVFSRVALLVRSFSSVCQPFCMKFQERVALYTEAPPTSSYD